MVEKKVHRVDPGLYYLATQKHKAEFEQLQAKNEELKKYAQHLPDCNLLVLIRCTSKNGKKVDCDCGFEQSPKR